MNIAFEGCFHGKLDEVYSKMQEIEKAQNIKIDVLVSCGDFQAIRNLSDLYSMKSPEKHFNLGIFHQYYSGIKKAPYLTIFIGGNHEASNHSRQLFFGGWVAPNIYYLGNSNVIILKKGQTEIRLGGISGIYKEQSFVNSYTEKYPFKNNSIVSCYHHKQLDVFKLNIYPNKVDILISHDWPNQIYHYGEVKKLVEQYPRFKQSVYSNTFGSPALFYLLQEKQPQWWVSGHMHCKFETCIQHQNNQVSNFLALDQCLPGRNYLQVQSFGENVEYEGQVELYYDPDWLSICQYTAQFIKLNLKQDFYFVKDNQQIKIFHKIILYIYLYLGLSQKVMNSFFKQDNKLNKLKTNFKTKIQRFLLTFKQLFNHTKKEILKLNKKNILKISKTLIIKQKNI